MCDYVVAIPSYKRAATLKKKTISLLQRQNIDKDRIYIFVADEEEKELYTAELPEYYREIVVGVVGMGAIRNFITDYFPEGQRIFHIDDDIDRFNLLTREKVKKEEIKAESRPFQPDELHQAICHGFKECDETGFGLWGIYPAPNDYFMRTNVTYDLRYIPGGYWGCVNSKSIRITMDDKEDFERSIKFYLKDGGVVRVQYVCAFTRCYKQPGGMQITRTKQRVLESAELLATRYPEHAKLNLKKKSGYAEVRLRDSSDKRKLAKKAKAVNVLSLFD
jgi:hypothetical protein